VTARLDTLEQNVAQMMRTLDRCFTQQKALADAINKLFELRPAAEPTVTEPAPAAPAATTAITLEPAAAPALLAPPTAVATLRPTGPIPGLSLRVAFE
jgi:hypothetical protein